MSIVKFEDVTRIYTSGEHELKALDKVSFTLDEGKFVVILGPSGAGKSTLLNLLGGLDSPGEGTITVNGRDISTLSDNELADYRAATVGFVFQFYNLIPTLTVYENVQLVSQIAPDALDAKQMIAEVGLTDHLHNFPVELSGGEQQRVSIARALAKNPKILLCDEPTGALDSETGVMVLKLLLSMAKNYGKTIVIVTHNQSIAKMADVVIRVKNGKIRSISEQEKRTQNRFNKSKNDTRVRLEDGVQEAIETLRDLKSNNAETEYIDSLDYIIKDYEKKSIAAELGVAAFIVPAQMFLKFGIATTALVGSALLLGGQITVITFFMFLLVVSRLYEPMAGTLINLGALNSAQVNIDRTNAMNDIKKQEGIRKTFEI